MEVNKMHVMPLLQNSHMFDRNHYILEQSTVQLKQQSPEIDIVPEAKDIQKIVFKMNNFIEPLQTNLKFVFHDELNEYYVTVINPLTNEVIKEIPPKKMLDMYAAMAQLMGFFIDRTV